MKDQNDIVVLHKWFSERNPFENVPELLSLSSGVVASEEVDCYKAYKVGSSITV